MKLLLTSSSPQSVTFCPSFPEKKYVPLSAGLSIPQNSDQQNVLAKRIQYFKDIFPNKEWTLNAEFCFYDPESPKLNITLEGELLKNLHDILYYGCNNERLQVSVRATVSHNIRVHALALGQFPNTQAVITDMEVDASKNAKKHFRYFKQGITLPEISTQNGNVWNSSIHLNWSITVELEVNDLVDLTGLLPQISDKNAKILEEKLFCDFEIVSSDGISIPCHKSMLSTSSDMFMAKCQGKLNEPSKNQMTMDMTGESVTALLEFIYCGEVRKPMTSNAIALELFQGGHKYDIVGLEPVMVAVFLQKSNEWYDVDVAFDLLRFMANYEGEFASELTKKVLEALAVKSDELKDCVLVQESFTKSPALAVQMFGMMAQEVKNRLG